MGGSTAGRVVELSSNTLLRKRAISALGSNFGARPSSYIICFILFYKDWVNLFCFVLFYSEEPRRSKFEILRPWCRAGLAKAPVILSPCNIRRWSHQKLAICFCYFFLSHTYFGYHRTELGFHELVHQKRYEIPAKNLSKRYRRELSIRS